jgi:hypothetical protein
MTKSKAQNKFQVPMLKTKMSLEFGNWDLFCPPQYIVGQPPMFFGG